jgi:CRISPR system Cascade subunit CasB
MTATTAAPTWDRAARYDSFVTRIVRVCRTEPRRRSELRRGLRLPPEKAMTMHAVVAPWLPDRPTPAVERAYYTTAAMIAAQPRNAPDAEKADEATAATASPSEATQPESRGRRPNLGWSLAQATHRGNGHGRGIAQDTAEKRLHLLVRQDLDGVHRQLPGAVRHLRALNVTVDWAQLMADLAGWTDNRDRITKEWLQTFYRTLDTTPTEGEAKHD